MILQFNDSAVDDAGNNNAADDGGDNDDFLVMRQEDMPKHMQPMADLHANTDHDKGPDKAGQ